MTAGENLCAQLLIVQARLANMEAEMQQRINAAVAENEQRMKGQREASEKNVHFSARVVALNSRMQNLQKQLKETQARERALMEELDEARQLAQTPQYEEELRPTPNGMSPDISAHSASTCFSSSRSRCPLLLL